jgi:FKBP-type peptidyl-prolyl cis-trans isomerase
MRQILFLFLACLPAMLAADSANSAAPVAVAAPQAVGPASAPGANTPAAIAAIPKAADFTEEQMLTEIGWVVAKRAQLPDLDFSPEQKAAILRGMTLSLDGKDAPLPLESANVKIAAYMQNRIHAARAAAQKMAQAKEATYFGGLKSKGVFSTPSGLYYEIVQPGSERKPTVNDSVAVKYTGRLLDRTVFDSSAPQGPPTVFKVSRLVRGWAEGIQLLGVGGKMKLYVPFSLAYGPMSQRGIPPFSTLEFEVELVDVIPAPSNSAPGNPGAGARPQFSPPSAGQATPIPAPATSPSK